MAVQPYSATAPIKALAGTEASPGITFTGGDTNTGIYSPAANQLGITTGGTSKLIIDEGGSLKVVRGTKDNPAIYFDGGTGIYSPGADKVAISTNGTERLFVDSSGVVDITSQAIINDSGDPYFSAGLTIGNGIAVRSPDYNPSKLLLVSSTNHGTGTIESNGDNTNGYLAFSTRRSGSTDERLRIDSSGRLLVGTSTTRGDDSTVQIVNDTANPLELLRGQTSAFGPALLLSKSRGSTASPTVVGDGDDVGTIVFRGYSEAASDYLGAARIEGQIDGTPDSGGDTTDMPGRLVFSVTADGASSPTEAMRINNARELLVGYTSDNGAYKLQVNSQIFATSATIATSDGRYKKNVASLSGCLDLIKALRPVSFTWKPQEDITRLDDEGNEVLVREGHNFPEGAQIGFIAQEVQEVLDGKPWLGSVIKENVRPAIKGDDGIELAPEEKFYGIVEGNLISVLTNALQEATAKIEDLEARLTAAGL